MKFLRSYLVQFVLFVVAVTCMQSCSCSRGESVSSKIDAFVSDDVDYVVAFNIERGFDAAEIKVKDGKPVLPDYMMELFEEASPRLEAMYEAAIDGVKGFGFTNVVMAGRATDNGNSMLVCFNITDAKEFYRSVEDFLPDFDVTEKDGKVLIGTDDYSIVVDGSTAVFVMKNNMPLGGSKAIREVEKWKENASEAPLAAWKRDYVTEDAIFSGWMNGKVVEKNSPRDWATIEAAINKLPGVKAKNVSVAGRVDLDGGELKANLTVFNGSDVMKSPVAGTIDDGMLKYVKRTDVAVFACGLNKLAVTLIDAKMTETTEDQIKYYQNLIDEYSEWQDMTYIQESLDNAKKTKARIGKIMGAFEGSALISFGVREDADMRQFRRDPSSCCDITLVAKAKSGKAKQALDVILEELTNSGYDMTMKGNNWTLKQKYSDTSLNIKLDGDYVIFSNSAISTDGKNKFSSSLFNSAWLAGEINVDADTPLLSHYDMPCGVDIKGSVDAMSGSIEVSFPGSKDKFIPTVVNIIRSVAGY